MNSIWIRSLFILSLFWGDVELFSQKHYTLTPDYIQLYHQAWECTEPINQNDVANLISADPENLLIYHFLNYFDFVALLTNEGTMELGPFNELVDHRIKQLKSGPKNSPYYYFSQAELYVQRAIIKSKHEQFIRAGWDINKAHKLLRTCREQFPEFQIASKSLSVIYTIAGSVKGFKRTMMQLLTSLDGTIPQGLEEIEKLYAWNLDHATLWSDEIITIQALIAGHIEQDWEEAFEVINQLSIQKRHTSLGLFLLSWTAGKANRNETVLRLLSGKEGVNQSFPVFEYLYGKAMLQSMDATANTYLLSFIERKKKGDYVGAACQRMAWYSLIFEEDLNNYHFWMSRVRELGKPMNIQDKQALQEAESGVIPSSGLLKSRLLFDGGYYQEAIVACDQVDVNTLNNEEQIELIYRRARIYQELGNLEGAKKLFNEVIAKGQALRSYYACNGALQMAQIFYNERAYQQAFEYANLSLSMNPKEQKKSLHNEARIIKGLTVGM